MQNYKPTATSYLIRRAYICWAGFFWAIGFLLLFPLFFLCIQAPKFRRIMPALNEFWCWIFFPAAFLRVCTSGRKNLPKGTCIYVSNHASYLDIPLLTYILPGFPAFMGKSSLARIPLFGYMFRNLHIVVQRNSSRGRAKAMQDTLNCLDKGRSVVIFPEGGINHSIQPDVADFKDGAFSLAIQTGLPVVPITICHNWYILPDDGHWLPRNGSCQSIIHSPLSTKGMTEKDIPQLREQVREIIRESLIENIRNGPEKYRRYLPQQSFRD
jgi:1-acyl-sn-glycerol-3-phosphate acyltransferase